MKRVAYFVAAAFLCSAAFVTVVVLAAIDVAPGTGFNLDGQGAGIYATRPTGADFTAGTTEAVLQVITHDSTGAAIDLDVDGNREIVVQTCGSNVGAATQTRLYIFEAEGNNDFRQRSTVLIDQGTNSSGFGLFRGVDIGNVDGDAALEIVSASGTGTNSFFTIYDVNTSTFAMTELVQTPVFGTGGLFTTSGTVSQIRILPNKNGGSNNDILISNATGTSIGTHIFAVEYNGSAVVFVNTTGANSGTVVNSGVISFNHGDFGDASDEELVMVTENVAAPLVIREYVTHATAPFGTAKTITTNWTGTTTGSLTTVAVADLDGDSDLDAAANDYTGKFVRAIKRTGVDTYTSEAIFAVALTPNPPAVEISDLDNDGLREVIYSNGTSVVFREHDGTADSFASADFGAETNLLTGLMLGTANAISFFGGSSTTLDNDLNFDVVVGRSVQVTDADPDMDSDEVFFLEADRTIAGAIPAGNYDNLEITANSSLSGSATIRGTLTLGGILTTGANTLTIDCTGSVTGASPTTYVDGNLKKIFCGTGVKGFEVGTANGYSPVSVNITAGTFPTDFTVRAVQGPQPNIMTSGGALQRYWKLAATGVTANLIFNYLDIDIPAPPSSENTFVIFKWDGSFTTPGGSVSPGTNEASISGVSDATLLSDWTLAQPNAPTAANALVAGYVLTNTGTPIPGTVVSLNGTQNRRTITNAQGYYQFDNVETNGFYTVTPSRANYSFGPANRSFSLIGNHTDATFTGSAISNNLNPLDTPEFFVRQQYLDVLGREPDEGGFNYWSDEILRCGSDAACVNARRREVAAAFFIEEEFQAAGSYIYDMYKGSLGRKPVFSEYVVDRQQVIGGPDLATQKAAFADGFVGRAEFVQRYQGNTTAESFVDALLQNVQQSSQVDLGSRRTALVNQYAAGGSQNQSRSLVLRALADDAVLKEAEYNAAFVLTEYFGYLRRDPEPEGYDFWLNVLNHGDVGNYRGMVCSFITSTEYQQRFSSVVSHSNAECGN